MQKLTLTVSENFYNALYSNIGKRNISRYIEQQLMPLVAKMSLAEEYKAMAADEKTEKEALQWSEGLIGDIADDEADF